MRCVRLRLSVRERVHAYACPTSYLEFRRHQTTEGVVVGLVLVEEEREARTAEGAVGGRLSNQTIHV